MFPHLLKNAPFAPCQTCPMSESGGYLFIRLSSPHGCQHNGGCCQGQKEQRRCWGWQLRTQSCKPQVESHSPLQGNCRGGWKDSPSVEGTPPCWSLSLLSFPAFESGSVSGAAGTLPMPCAWLPVRRLLSSVISPRWNRLTGLWFREGHSPSGSEIPTGSFGTSCRSLWIQQIVDSQNKLPKYFLQSVT